jgi:hypothetical protein
MVPSFVEVGGVVIGCSSGVELARALTPGFFSVIFTKTSDGSRRHCRRNATTAREHLVVLGFFGSQIQQALRRGQKETQYDGAFH